MQILTVAKNSLKIVRMATSKPIIVFVLGNPGAGKGTQCSRMVEKYGFVHLSAGDLLRAERRSGSAHGELIESHIREGKIVPVEITISLIEKAMEKASEGAKSPRKFLVDGFPRNADNLDGWERRMKETTDVRAVLYFETSEDVCWERVKKRSEAEGRSDDNRDSFLKRLKTHVNDTLPIVRKYEELGLVRRLSGESSPDDVFREVQKHIDELC